MPGWRHTLPLLYGGLLILGGCGGTALLHTPSATFTVVPQNGTVEKVFFVDASVCSDAEDPADLLQVRWDWEGDGIYDTDFSTAKSATHRYATPGSYRLTLETRDSDGMTATTTMMVTVVTQGGDVEVVVQ